MCGWNIKKQIKKEPTGHFAECNTRQRGSLSSVQAISLDKEPNLGTGIGSLPSVVALTLGKEARFAECHTEALGKEPDMGTLPNGLFAECPRWHSAKTAALPSAAWKTLGKAAVSVTRRRNGRFSLPSARWHSAKRFAECPRKSTRQRRLCRCTVCRAFFAECHTR